MVRLVLFSCMDGARLDKTFAHRQGNLAQGVLNNSRLIRRLVHDPIGARLWHDAPSIPPVHWCGPCIHDKQTTVNNKNNNNKTSQLTRGLVHGSSTARQLGSSAARQRLVHDHVQQARGQLWQRAVGRKGASQPLVAPRVGSGGSY
jgi:hypothetical protein